MSAEEARQLLMQGLPDITVPELDRLLESSGPSLCRWHW
jgi:hypothetical protein